MMVGSLLVVTLFGTALGIQSSTGVVDQDEEQRANARKEDYYANMMWRKYVDNINGVDCTASKLVSAFAKDTSAWNREADMGNPEAPRTPAEAGTANDVIAANRAKMAIAAAGGSCASQLDLLGSNFVKVREFSMYEFLFKSPNGWTEGSNQNIRECAATAAYSHVRCMNELGQVARGCNKQTDGAKLSYFFKFGKGRATNRPTAEVRDASVTTNGGIMTNGPNGQIGAIENFWKSSERNPDSCAEALDFYCGVLRADGVTRGNSDMGNNEEQRKMCNIVTAQCTGADARGALQAPVPKVLLLPATLVDNVDGYNQIIKRFQKCRVVYVGGISGSVIEMFSFYQDRAFSAVNPRPIDDILIMQWMAYYVLRGFHSLGEVWSALKPFLEFLNYSTAGGLKFMDVSAPLNWKTGACTNGKESENDFLRDLLALIHLYNVQQAV